MDQLLHWGRDALLLAALGLLPAAVVALISYVLRRRSPAGRQAGSRHGYDAVLDAALVASVAGIVIVAIRPGIGVTPAWEQWVLIPFRDLLRSFSGSERSLQLAIGNLVGNAALYVPLGLALAFRFRWMGLLPGIVLAAALSFGMECVQAILATGRTSDVTDILMNSTGAAVGIAAARYWLSIRRNDGVHAARRPAP